MHLLERVRPISGAVLGWLVRSCWPAIVCGVRRSDVRCLTTDIGSFAGVENSLLPESSPSKWLPATGTAPVEPHQGSDRKNPRRQDEDKDHLSHGPSTPPSSQRINWRPLISSSVAGQHRATRCAFLSGHPLAVVLFAGGGGHVSMPWICASLNPAAALSPSVSSATTLCPSRLSANSLRPGERRSSHPEQDRPFTGTASQHHRRRSQVLR